MVILFEIIGEIKTKKRPRPFVMKHGKASCYTPKDTLYYENYVRECYLNAVKDKEFKSFGNKPLAVRIGAYFKAPKKYEKYGNKIADLACDKNKDLDNIAKIVLDSLNKVAYDDDKQIYDLSISKFWTGVQERIVVKIKTCDEDCKWIYDLKHFKVKYKPERKGKRKEVKNNETK